MPIDFKSTVRSVVGTPELTSRIDELAEMLGIDLNTTDKLTFHFSRDFEYGHNMFVRVSRTELVPVGRSVFEVENTETIVIE